MLESLFKTLEDFAFLFGILVGGAKTMQAKSEQEERQERQKRIRSMQRNIFLDIEPISGRDLFCYFYRKALGYLSKQKKQDGNGRAVSKFTLQFLLQENIPLYRVVELFNRYDPMAVGKADYGMKLLEEHHRCCNLPFLPIS